jgi:hypothetical protein
MPNIECESMSGVPIEKDVFCPFKQRETLNGQDVPAVVSYGRLLTGNKDTAPSDVDELSYQEPA